MRGLWSQQQSLSVVGGKALAGDDEDNARYFSATGGQFILPRGLLEGELLPQLTP